MKKFIMNKIVNYVGIHDNISPFPSSSDQLWDLLRQHPTGTKFLARNRISTMDELLSRYDDWEHRYSPTPYCDRDIDYCIDDEGVYEKLYDK